MEKVLLDLPFYPNKFDGNQCAVIAIKIAAKHFLGKNYSLNKIDKLIGRPLGKWTWNEQVVAGMDKIGLETKVLRYGRRQKHLGRKRVYFEALQKKC